MVLSIQTTPCASKKGVRLDKADDPLFHWTAVWHCSCQADKAATDAGL